MGLEVGLDENLQTNYSDSESRIIIFFYLGSKLMTFSCV